MRKGRLRRLSGLDETLTAQPGHLLVGGSPRHLRDIVLGVVRDGLLLRIGAPEADAVEASDRLLYIRNAGY